MTIYLFRKQDKTKSKYIKRKILLLGDGAVGKTSLIRKFVLDKFDDKYIATIGTKVTKKELELKSGGRTFYLTLMIWDVLGQKGYRAIQSASFKGADGVILVCDFTRKETLESLEDYWLANIGKELTKLKMVFVANKADLTKNAQFSLDELGKIATKYGSLSFSSSAKTGENVEELFFALGRSMIETEGGEEFKGPILVGNLPEKMTIVDAADWIINDFCDNYGDMETAMPIIRQQFNRAQLDIKEPTREGLIKVIGFLAEVERGFKDESIVRQNTTKRRLILDRVKK